MAAGYKADFIDPALIVEMPELTGDLATNAIRSNGKLRDDLYADHIHFSLVMNQHTRQLIFAAQNIDLDLHGRDVEGEKGWDFDEDHYEDEQQLGNKYYKDRKGPNGETIHNPYDRGHMVMRFNNVWGETDEEADKAGEATFIYSNAALQHKNLNRDEWKHVEMNVTREIDIAEGGRLCVFTGPIWGDLDRHVHISDSDSARAPAGFFKVIAFRMKGVAPAELGVLAFAIFQDERVLRDRKGAATVKTDQRYQVTIEELRRLTGLHFSDALFDANPLLYFENEANMGPVFVKRTPERIPINRFGDVIRRNQPRSPQSALAERKIAINSAMIAPKTGGDEWVSLHNRSDEPADVTGWTLMDRHERDATLNGVVQPGESLVVSGEALGAVKLANDGGSLMLLDGGGGIVDHATWSAGDVRRTGKGFAHLFERGQ